MENFEQKSHIIINFKTKLCCYSVTVEIEVARCKSIKIKVFKCFQSFQLNYSINSILGTQYKH